MEENPKKWNIGACWDQWNFDISTKQVRRHLWITFSLFQKCKEVY